MQFHSPWSLAAKLRMAAEDCVIAPNGAKTQASRGRQLCGGDDDVSLYFYY